MCISMFMDNLVVSSKNNNNDIQTMVNSACIVGKKEQHSPTIVTITYIGFQLLDRHNGDLGNNTDQCELSGALLYHCRAK